MATYNVALKSQLIANESIPEERKEEVLEQEEAPEEQMTRLLPASSTEEKQETKVEIDAVPISERR